MTWRSTRGRTLVSTTAARRALDARYPARAGIKVTLDTALHADT